jgi:hypothetical protein
MNKKKILGIAVAALIGISSIVPAFADTTTDSQNQTTTTTQSQTKQSGKHKKYGKLTLAQRAAKLGVDITGLTDEQAKEKIMEARAAKLGVDITGLSKEDAMAKIKAAIQENGKNKAVNQTENATDTTSATQ